MSNIDHSTTSKLIWPPDSVRGMRDLNRDLFRRTVRIPFVVAEINNFAAVVNLLQPYFLKIMNLKPVQEYQSSNQKQIFLNPDKLEQFEPIIENLVEARLLSRLNSNDEYIGHKEMELNYEHFNHLIIFRSIFGDTESDGDSSLSGFSTIGHIIHLNLREHMLPYKKLIGQVIQNDFFFFEIYSSYTLKRFYLIKLKVAVWW